ncbi:MAG TPA: AI-2E family transporter, partial [Solirubrobacterales bacterium]
MTGQSAVTEGGAGRREVEVSLSIRTILIVAAVVAVALALASIGDVLLLIFVSAFSVAVLSPVVDLMERRLPWGRGLCATVLVLGIVVLGIGFVVVLSQAVVDGVRNFSQALPGLVDQARHSDLGGLVNGQSDALDVLKAHTNEITSGLGKASGGLAQVGVSAFGAVALVFSVTFLTLFGLIDEPRVRSGIGNLLYRDSRERYERLTDRIIKTTSRYMLGNLAISVI